MRAWLQVWNFRVIELAERYEEHVCHFGRVGLQGNVILAPSNERRYLKTRPGWKVIKAPQYIPLVQIKPQFF